ncbi:MAG: asparagine synthase (glutamine-hydrolyzing) [Candidatus Aenigmatarchaeota archaeon]
MCGIAGIFGEYDINTLKKMTNILYHRGPDDRGFYSNEKIGLGNRRLAIIDLEGGHQPIHNEDESIWVTFNGEIYNFLELKKILESEGHKFYTNTDTEVIVHAYEQYGPECVKKFNGMFAFAIWDERKKRLMLARDYCGIKPLYYTVLKDGSVIFASEIKSILQDERAKIQPDFQSIHEFLNLRYFPREKTPFFGIKKLLPGHYLLATKNKIVIKKYNEFVYKPINAPENYFIQKLNEIIKNAIKRHMISDVPIGFYLSGGIDSSTIVYFAKEVSGNSDLKTFCMGFNEEMDEFNDAQLVADALGTDHHNILIKQSFIEETPKLIWYTDMPKRNLYPYYISEAASKYVKVVLNGLGGDELFGGYEWKYQYAEKLNRIISNKLFIPKKNFKNPIYDLTSDQFLSFLRNFDRTSQYILIQSADKIYPHEYPFIYGDKFYSVSKKLKLPKKYYLKFFKTKNSFLDQILMADFSVKLSDDFLLVEDATSMAHSLEARVPFLDKELVEFSFKIPSFLKVKNNQCKYILKKALSSKLNLQTLNKRKQGFGPNTYNIYVKELRDYACQWLLNGNLFKEGILNKNYIKKILESNPEKTLIRKYNLIWNLLSLEVWWKIYIENKPTSKPPKFKL